MNNLPPSGHDGPYPAPIIVGGRTVLPDWIDYNGHMNVGYYGIAFDTASDVLLSDHLGIGEEFVQAAGQGPYALQTHTQYLREMREGETFAVAFRLLDHDAKRLHIFAGMTSEDSGALSATQEIVLMNVDHGTGRSAPYPDWALRRLERMKADHAPLDRLPQVGATIGLRRGG